MALKIRRGPNSERGTIVPVQGEPIFTTDTKELFIGDGETPGGKSPFPVKTIYFSTSSADPDQVVEQLPLILFMSAKYIVQVSAGNERQVCEIRIFHNETQAFITEYGVMYSDTRLASFDADIDSGNLRFLVTPQQGGLTTFQIHSQALRK